MSKLTAMQKLDLDGAVYALMGGDELTLVSGEGEQGHVEQYAGARTRRAFLAKIRKLAARGDRWVRVQDSAGRTIVRLDSCY